MSKIRAMSRFIIISIMAAAFCGLAFNSLFQPAHVYAVDLTIPAGCPGGPAGPMVPGTDCSKKVKPCSSGSILGLPTWYEYLQVGPRDGDKCAIIGPLNTPSDIKSGVDWGKASGKIGLAVVDILLRLAGVVTVFFVIYGGIRLTLSEGEPDNFKKAKETIFNALIGLLIVLVATAAVNFVGNTLK